MCMGRDMQSYNQASKWTYRVDGRDSNPAYNHVNTLKDIYHFVRTFDQSVKLVFLHLPYYSISNYYKHKGDTNHEQY